MGALTIANVRKTFGQVEILKGIDIDIEAGEFLILVGPSGCGKSTLLNIIAGLELPTDGAGTGERATVDYLQWGYLQWSTTRVRITASSTFPGYCSYTAMMNSGVRIVASAMVMRWRMPPESSCG